MAKSTNAATTSAPEPTAGTAPAVAADSAVVRRYRAYGEARELNIACIAHGYIVIEQLADGTYRFGDEEQPLLEPSAEALAEALAVAVDPAPVTPEPAPTPTPEPAPEPAPGALSGQSEGAVTEPSA